MTNERRAWVEPRTVAELRLPPTFVTDHAIRALAYQGAMTPSDLASRWHIDDAVAVEVIASLKAAGLIELDIGQATFERSGRVRLTSAGSARIDSARRRTWYAGALPVSLDDYGQQINSALSAPAPVVRVGDAVRSLAIAPELADEIGQAICAGATVALRGTASEEQATIATALADGLGGEVSLPFALYAAGAVIRLVDPRYHVASAEVSQDAESTDFLRSRESQARWMLVRRPLVMLSGGVQPTDVRPAYDDEARFYVAPPPLAACHGLLAVLDCDASPASLSELARLWLIPGRHGAGVLLLRSGERIEIPWRASTLLFVETTQALAAGLLGASTYRIDISDLAPDALRIFLTGRVPEPDLAETLAALLERRDIATRVAAANASRYLRDRAAYGGGPASLSASALGDAVDFAAATQQAPPSPLRIAS